MYNATLNTIATRAGKKGPAALNIVHYCKAEQSYIACDGCMLIQEYTADEYEGNRYFMQNQDITNTYLIEHTFPNWQALLTKNPVSVPANFTEATLYTRTSKASYLAKNLIETADGILFNADYLKEIYTVLGAGGKWTHNEDQRIYYYTTTKGRAFVCRIKDTQAGDYTEARKLNLDELAGKKTKVKTVFVICEQDGDQKVKIVAVAKSQKTAIDFAKNYPNPVGIYPVVEL